MYLLISHQCKNHPKWELDAAWDKNPKIKDILSLNAFSEHTALDYAVAKSIIDNNYCGIYQGTDIENVFEYMLIEHQSGDVNLNDYLYSGYWDCHEITDPCIIGPSSFEYLRQPWAAGMELTFELIGLGSGPAKIINKEGKLFIDVENQSDPMPLEVALKNKDVVLLRN